MNLKIIHTHTKTDALDFLRKLRFLIAVTQFVHLPVFFVSAHMFFHLMQIKHGSESGQWINIKNWKQKLREDPVGRVDCSCPRTGGERDFCREKGVRRWKAFATSRARRRGYNWYFLCAIFDIPVTSERRRRRRRRTFDGMKTAPRVVPAAQKNGAHEKTRAHNIYIYNVIITVIIILRRL